jgi:hypothetical protein
MHIQLFPYSLFSIFVYWINICLQKLCQLIWDLLNYTWSFYRYIIIPDLISTLPTFIPILATIYACHFALLESKFYIGSPVPSMFCQHWLLLFYSAIHPHHNLRFAGV